jgi:hypothetical protein
MTGNRLFLGMSWIFKGVAQAHNMHRILRTYNNVAENFSLILHVVCSSALNLFIYFPIYLFLIILPV